MAMKDSIMKQSTFFWVIGHRLSFANGLKKFLFGAWRNFSVALKELILTFISRVNTSKSFRQKKSLFFSILFLECSCIAELGMKNVL